MFTVKNSTKTISTVADLRNKAVYLSKTVTEIPYNSFIT